MTASTSTVKLEVETVLAALSSWMAVIPCLTVKPHPDWSLVTEPSVYTTKSCSLLFPYMRSLISDSVLPAGHSQQSFPKISGRIECLIVVPKMVWVPFPSLISFSGQLATQDLPRPSLHLFVSFTDF